MFSARRAGGRSGPAVDEGRRFVDTTSDGSTMTVIATTARARTFSSRARAGHSTGGRWSAEVLRTGRPARIEEYAEVPGSLAARARESRIQRRVAGAPIIVDGSRLGSHLDIVAGRAAPRSCRGSARGVHGVGGNRDRQQPGPRGAHATRGGAGGVAAGGDAGCSGRATGRGVRSRERGGGGIDRRGRFGAHALRGRRDRHCGKRLDDRGRIQLRRAAATRSKAPCRA